MSVKTRPRPLHWIVGCNAFGLLGRPDGSQNLVETVRFEDREASVVRLSDGARELVPWATCTYTFASVDDAFAAARAGMPAPRRVKVGSDWRRVDPFHTERHRSAVFRALVAMIYAHRLPCRYSLIAAGRQGRAPEYSGPAEEDPEQTAGNTAERLARTPALTYQEALHAELLEDATIAVGARQAPALLERFGWSPVLKNLEQHLAAHATDKPTLPHGADIVAFPHPETQLNLLDGPAST